VVAAEECFGLLLLDERCAEWPDEVMAKAAAVCPVWSRWYELAQSVRQDQRGLTRAALIARCEDAALCELVDCCCARVIGTAATVEAFAAARARVGLELGAWRMEDLRRALGRAEAADGECDRAFGNLLGMARGYHSVLPTEKRGVGLSAT
jgi:hypothetical protein